MKMPGLLDIKGTTKSFVGPGGKPAKLPALPTGIAVFEEPPSIPPPPRKFKFSV
ncbi:hypothetical protein D3C87_1253050 [compost metagenome]